MDLTLQLQEMTEERGLRTMLDALSAVAQARALDLRSICPSDPAAQDAFKVAETLLKLADELPR